MVLVVNFEARGDHKSRSICTRLKTNLPDCRNYDGVDHPHTVWSLVVQMYRTDHWTRTNHTTPGPFGCTTTPTYHSRTDVWSSLKPASNNSTISLYSSFRRLGTHLPFGAEAQAALSGRSDLRDRTNLFSCLLVQNIVDISSQYSSDGRLY